MFWCTESLLKCTNNDILCNQHQQYHLFLRLQLHQRQQQFILNENEWMIAGAASRSKDGTRFGLITSSDEKETDFIRIKKKSEEKTHGPCHVKEYCPLFLFRISGMTPCSALRETELQGHIHVIENAWSNCYETAEGRISRGTRARIF